MSAQGSDSQPDAGRCPEIFIDLRCPRGIVCRAVGELTVAGARLRARMVGPRRRNVPGDNAEIRFVVCMRFRISILYAGGNAYLFGIPLRMDFAFLFHRVSFRVFTGYPFMFDKHISASRRWKYVHEVCLTETQNGKMEAEST